MKDASKRSKPNSDDEDQKVISDPNRTEKPKRKRLRKRRSSCSPEEDVIDGFVIASYSSLHSLEASPRPSSPACLGGEQDRKQSTSKAKENGHDNSKPSKEGKKGEGDGETSKITRKKGKTKKPAESEKTVKLSRQYHEQLTDESSDSGNSGKGYICDGESEDEQPPEQKPKIVANASGAVKDIPSSRPEQPEQQKEEKEEKEAPTNKTASPITFDTERIVSSPKPKIANIPPLSLAVPSSLSITTPRSSYPITPQSSWYPKLSSSFQKTSSVTEPCCGPGSYTGADALHQELNNRFLQSHSDRERHGHAKSQELHQHSHLHHHQHQHQHTHYYPSPLLPPTMFPSPAPVHGLLSPFSTPVPAYNSHMISAYPKQTGKWCNAHVRIAWKIYCHQQRIYPVYGYPHCLGAVCSKVQTEMSKDPHVKPEHISISKSTTSLVPPFPPRHVSPGDLGCHSPHAPSSRMSGSPFSKSSVLLGRSASTPAPFGSAVTSTTSAFSSVFSPPTVIRHTTSPSLVGPSSRGSASLELEKRSTTSVASSTLYPWLKSDRAVQESGPVVRRERPECETEKTDYTVKNEPSRRSSPKLSSNFSVQALAGERPETHKPRSLGAFDPTGTHATRDTRPLDTRPCSDSALMPLDSSEKRPLDYRPGAGSIDLNRNTLYPRFDPMMSMHPPHVTSLTPPMGFGYVHAGVPFMADAMYHTPLGPSMYLGSRDPMASFGRSHDMGFYMRRDRAWRSHEREVE